MAEPSCPPPSPGPSPRSRPLAVPAKRFWSWTAALLCAATTLLFFRALFLGETFSARDLSGYYHPAKALIAPLTRASDGIPLWNPFFSSGQPFAANPEHEVFCPFTTLFFFLPFEVAFRLQVILPVLATLAAMYALLRTLRRTRPAALAGALAWALGGYVLSNSNLLPILFAVFILPLTLTFVVRLARAPTAFDVSALALCFGVQCLAGEPSTLLATGPLALAAFLAVEPRPGRRAALAVLAGLALGGLLGAVALLPGLHHAGKTDRALGFPPEIGNEWSMPPVRVLDLVSPHVLGEIVPGDEARRWGRSLYPGRESPYFFSLYPGLVVSLLAIVTWARRPRRMLPWIACAGLGLVLALGGHLPVWPLLRRLPLLSGLRFPEKFALLFALPLVVAAATGFDHVVLGLRRAGRPIERALVALAALAAVVAGVVGWAGPRIDSGIDHRAATWFSLRVSLVALASLAVLALGRRLRREPRALLLCALLAADLTLVGRVVLQTLPVPEMAAPPRPLLPLVNRAQDDVLFHAVQWDRERGNIDGTAKPPLPARWGLGLTLDRDYDMTYLRASNQASALFMRAITAEPRLRAPLLERRGVTAIVQLRPGAHWRGDRVVGPDGGVSFEVLTSHRAQPFAFAARGVVAAPGGPGWLAAVSRLGSAVRDTAIVESADLPAFAGPPAPAEVRVASRTPVKMALEVDARGPTASFVAINQTWDEGWRASIDGRPAPLLRTEIALSGLVVPPGKHRVVLEYSDSWVSTGLALSLLALMLCLVLVLFGRRDGPAPSFLEIARVSE